MPPFVQGLGCLARAAGTLLARPCRADADDRAASFFRFTAQSLDEQAPGRIIDTLVQAGLRGGPVGAYTGCPASVVLPSSTVFFGRRAMFRRVSTSTAMRPKREMSERARRHWKKARWLLILACRRAAVRERIRARRATVRVGRFLPRLDTHTSTGGVGRIGLERVHKPPSSQVSFSTQRGPHRWLRGPPEDAPATLGRLLTLRNGAGAGAERRVTDGGRRIVCGWHQRILGSIKT